MERVALLRRVTMWIEAAVAIGIIVFGVYCVEDADRYGATRFFGEGFVAMFAVMFLAGALAFGLGAMTLRSTSRLGWYGQLFPLAAILWVLWRVLSAA